MAEALESRGVTVRLFHRLRHVPLEVLTQFLELAYDGMVLHLATGRPPGELSRVLDLVEDAVRKG